MPRIDPLLNELMATAVAAQTVSDLMHALNTLHDRGIYIAAEDLAHFSPYSTSKVKRIGDYPAPVSTDSQPIRKHSPVTSVAQELFNNCQHLLERSITLMKTHCLSVL